MMITVPTSDTRAGPSHAAPSQRRFGSVGGRTMVVVALLLLDAVASTMVDVLATACRVIVPVGTAPLMALSNVPGPAAPGSGPAPAPPPIATARSLAGTPTDASAAWLVAACSAAARKPGSSRVACWKA